MQAYDKLVVLDAGGTFKGAQHPQKQVARGEQSPTMEDDQSSDKTEPDDFMTMHDSGSLAPYTNTHGGGQSDSSENHHLYSQVSPRNYYYNNH